MSSQIILEKKRPKTIGPWFESRTPKQQSDSFRRARAQWGPKKILPRKADDGPWTWPINLERYDRSPQLTSVEKNMLTRYEEAYRFYRYGRTMNATQRHARLYGNHHESSEVRSAFLSTRDDRTQTIFLGMDYAGMDRFD